ncbi:MAG: hypothetical protein ACTHK3_00985 [Solirubrobacterales bacterium]
MLAPARQLHREDREVSSAFPKAVGRHIEAGGASRLKVTARYVFASVERFDGGNRDIKAVANRYVIDVRRDFVCARTKQRHVRTTNNRLYVRPALLETIEFAQSGANVIDIKAQEDHIRTFINQVTKALLDQTHVALPPHKPIR